MPDEEYAAIGRFDKDGKVAHAAGRQCAGYCGFAGDSRGRICGAKDLTTLPAHSEYSVLQLIGEIVLDWTKWRTEKHFTSWLGLAPGSAQSGKRKVPVKRRRNRAGQLFCVMARALARSKYVALGGFYRRMGARCGGLVANKALARKPATLFLARDGQRPRLRRDRCGSIRGEGIGNQTPHPAPTGSSARPANRPQSSRRRLTACSWRGFKIESRPKTLRRARNRHAAAAGDLHHCKPALVTAVGAEPKQAVDAGKA